MRRLRYHVGRMITVTGLAKAYGARTLFEDVTLQLNAGSRYGLVGANGSGKTTFLRILAGDEEAIGGVGARQQGRPARRAPPGSLPGRRGDHPRPGHARRRRGLERAGRAAAHRGRGRTPTPGGSPTSRTSSPPTTATPSRRGPAPCSRASASRSPSHRSPLATLSGGFKLRVLLAQVLVGGADVLLLDEPTNHLDILSIRWLEKFLAGYAGCAVVISHDQRFLDNVTTHILDVDYGTITLYTGNYSHVRRREGRRSRERKETRDRARRGRDRPQARLGRALRRQGHQGHARPRAASSRSRRSRSRSWSTSSRRAPAVALRARAPERPRRAGASSGCRKSYGEKRVLTRRVAGGAAGRAGGHHRPQRPRQVDAAEDRRRAPGAPTRGDGPLGPRDPRRLLPPGPPRGARRPATPRRSSCCGPPVPAETTDLRARAAGAGAVLGRRRQQEGRRCCRAARRRG